MKNPLPTVFEDFERESTVLGDPTGSLLRTLVLCEKWAAQMGEEDALSPWIDERARRLLAQGADPNAIVSASAHESLSQRPQDSFAGSSLDANGEANGFGFDVDGAPALSLALQRHQFGVAKALLDAGADPFSPECNAPNLTPWIFAIESGFDATLFMVRAGASLTGKVGSESLLCVAASTGASSVASFELLRKKGAKKAPGEDLVAAAIESDDLEMAVFLLTQRGNGNLQTAYAAATEARHDFSRDPHGVFLALIEAFCDFRDDHPRKTPTKAQLLAQAKKNRVDVCAACVQTWADQDPDEPLTQRRGRWLDFALRETGVAQPENRDRALLSLRKAALETPPRVQDAWGAVKAGVEANALRHALLADSAESASPNSPIRPQPESVDKKPRRL